MAPWADKQATNYVAITSRHSAWHNSHQPTLQGYHFHYLHFIDEEVWHDPGLTHVLTKAPGIDHRLSFLVSFNPSAKCLLQIIGLSISYASTPPVPFLLLHTSLDLPLSPLPT